MTTKFIVTMLSLWTSLSFRAQDKGIELKGKIIDATTNQPLEYATISIINPKTKSIKSGSITDLKGAFSIQVPADTYNVTFEYISFKTQTITNKTFTANTDLGTIGLELDTESLDDVVVIAEKTTVDIKLDKKIYNVGKDLTVSGGTVSDVLDNVPSVSVDVEGAVSLRGNDNVRILINGKPSGLVGLNSTNALRQLPAESIERVEVITSPSARYDAEGSAGILNIILKRSKLQGLNGAITINGGHPTTTGISGNINYRTGDFNFFTTSGYSYRENPGNTFSKTQYFNTSTDPDTGIPIDLPDTFLQETRDLDRTRNGINTNVGVEWYVNDSSSITTSYLYRDSNNDRFTTNQILELDPNQNILEENTRIDPEVEDDTTQQFSLNYNKNFNDNGHKLTFDFQIEDSNENETSAITQTDRATIERVFTDEHQNRTLLQSDYVLPLQNEGQLEFGYRGNFNELETDFLVQNDVNGVITINTDLSNTLVYKEQVNAIYTQWGKKTGKLSWLLGLRMEATRIVIDQQTSNNFDRKNYAGLFPTLNLNYNLTEKQSINLGYNRRIRRPRARAINPFPSRSSATNLFQGNPDLNPSYTHALDLGYLNRLEKLTINSSIYYNRSTQVFSFITEDTGLTTTVGTENTEVPILRRTFANLASSDRYGFEFTTSYRPKKGWRINGSFNAFQNSTRGTFNDQNLDNDNFNWFTRLSNKMTLPTKIDWQTNLFYFGPRENAQSESEGIFTMTLAFSKDLFQEKATVTLNINDVFNSRKRRSTTTLPTLITESEYQFRQRRINLAFTYRFNQKKTKQRPQLNRDSETDFEGQ